jgi:hypothetical protein
MGFSELAVEDYIVHICLPILVRYLVPVQDPLDLTELEWLLTVSRISQLVQHTYGRVFGNETLYTKSSCVRKEQRQKES